jgi:hypothetical protein
MDYLLLCVGVVIWVKWDDGNYSCHAQRDLKRVGTLYGRLD